MKNKPERKIPTSVIELKNCHGCELFPGDDLGWGDDKDKNYVTVVNYCKANKDGIIRPTVRGNDS